MEIEDRLLALISDLRKVLDDHVEQLKCFIRAESQFEYWFKAELFYFLEIEKGKHLIKDFEREVRLNNRQRVDFRITFGSYPNIDDAWVELKHWLIGYQKGTKYDLDSYFTDEQSSIQDVEKLFLTPEGPKYLLVIATRNPGHDKWVEEIKRFNVRNAPFYVRAVTDPKDYPETYFIGLLRASKKGANH